jgi:hypothetical protein
LHPSFETLASQAPQDEAGCVIDSKIISLPLIARRVLDHELRSGGTPVANC